MSDLLEGTCKQVCKLVIRMLTIVYPLLSENFFYLNIKYMSTAVVNGWVLAQN